MRIRVRQGHPRWQPWFRVVALGCGLLAGAPSASRLLAQDSLPPWQGGLTASLGQPSRTWPYAGATFGFDWRAGRSSSPVVYGAFGVTQGIGSPVKGILAASAEAYGGLRSSLLDGGVRALLQMPILRILAGGDYNLREGRLGLMVGLSLPIRRGGVFGGGSVLRAEWSPGALSAFRASVLVPVGQPGAGRTRPRVDHVDVAPPVGETVPKPVASPGLEPALANVQVGVAGVGHLLVPYLDRSGRDPRAALEPLIAELRSPSPLPGVTGPGLRIESQVEAYHAELVRAFSIAASGRPVPEGASTPDGELAAAQARKTLRDHVLYPYDRLLGQWKTGTTLAGLAAYARGNFARDLVLLTSLPPEREAAVLYVFEQLLEAVTSLEKEERSRWGDSRLVWLPLQLGLKSDDHDTQAKLDAIVEGVLGVQFTDGNRVWYVVNEQFQAEVTRSIQQAEDYHVLWIHDFAGRTEKGLPDVLSLRYVVDVYLRALARRIREYDSRRRLPVYMIFIDEHYYETHRGRLWLDVLEQPLEKGPTLPRAFASLADSVRKAQEDLRDAIASSRLLQAEVRQYGDRWLRNLVKVHVSVTNPADQSFWSRQIVPLLGIPDNIMRDHRKIAFYDITEDDPYRGLAIYTGMGIGEEYAGPTWEDRALLVQGPAVLSLKTQARRLLEGQGIAPGRIPYPLRARPLAPDYQAAVEAEIAHPRGAGGHGQRAVELHNGTGFQEKQVSVVKATLYGLMPAGSVIKVPDSLWGNALFASLLTGSALRGCRVLFVSPSVAAAPNPGWPTLVLVHDLFARLIVLQQEFGPELQAVDGMLKTGIYNPGIGVWEIGARFASAYKNGRRTPFLRDLFPVDASVDSLLAHARELVPPSPTDSGRIRTGREVMPKLHLKANFFASREGWDSLLVRPELAQVLQAYVAQLVSTDPQRYDARVAAEALGAASDRVVTAFRATLSDRDRERLVYYLLMGSANEDYRSMLMDGEASVLLSGWSGVVGLIDFSLIMNLSVWIDDLEMLDALLPAPTGLQRAIARQVRPAL